MELSHLVPIWGILGLDYAILAYFEGSGPGFGPFLAYLGDFQTGFGPFSAIWEILGLDLDQFWPLL